MLDHLRNKMLQKSLIENKATCCLETFLVKCFQILRELPKHKRTSRKKHRDLGKLEVGGVLGSEVTDLQIAVFIHG